jgi:hypothetical protein
VDIDEGAVMRNFIVIALLLTGCSSAAKQEDTHGVAAPGKGGRVVEFSGVQGKYPKIDSVSLYFYPGKFEIPLESLGGGRYRGSLSAEEVSGMARQPHGFRVYRARLSIISRADTGEKDTKTQDLTVALEP